MTVLRSTSLPKVVPPEVKNGSCLVGDDFSSEQLQRWFAEEQEAFYEGDAGNSEEDPWYAYMRYVNNALGFTAVEKRCEPVRNMLVLGPGSGKEVEQFAAKNPECQLHFLEASKNFQQLLRERFVGSSVVLPQYSGDIALADNSQDVVCAFSVLHHIPNVSKVISELGRITQRGGLLMIREPCSSMGDWRGQRSATPNERGISRTLITKFAEQSGFELVRRPTAIILEPFNKILKKTVGFRWIPFRALYIMDRVTSGLLSFNDHYWRDTFWRKCGPSSYFYLFKKL
jgi:SAM-dependent methyltransferase